MTCPACNPYCGRCRPAKEKPVQCEACHTFNLRDLRPDNTCRKCGAKLPRKHHTVLCAYSGKSCAHPCLRATTPAADGSLKICPTDISKLKRNK